MSRVLDTTGAVRRRRRGVSVEPYLGQVEIDGGIDYRAAIRISWTVEPAEVTKYHIHRHESDEFFVPGAANRIAIINAPVGLYDDVPTAQLVGDEKTFWYKVVPYKGVSRGLDPLNAWQGRSKPDAQAPATQSVLQVGNDVNISFTEPFYNAAKFEHSTSPTGPWTVLNPLFTSPFTHVAPGVGTHYYRVAVAGAGEYPTNAQTYGPYGDVMQIEIVAGFHPLDVADNILWGAEYYEDQDMTDPAEDTKKVQAIKDLGPTGKHIKTAVAAGAGGVFTAADFNGLGSVNIAGGLNNAFGMIGGGGPAGLTRGNWTFFLLCGGFSDETNNTFLGSADSFFVRIMTINNNPDTMQFGLNSEFPSHPQFSRAGMWGSPSLITIRARISGNNVIGELWHNKNLNGSYTFVNAANPDASWESPKQVRIGDNTYSDRIYKGKMALPGFWKRALTNQEVSDIQDWYLEKAGLP